MASFGLMNESAPPPEAARLNSQGMLALRAGSYAEAERLFVAAIMHDTMSVSYTHLTLPTIYSV